MDKTPVKVTPMMKQFLELKNEYHDCILLFRTGDFYETFYDDAKVATEVLGITLTKRGDTPMAGVPYHSINPYIKKLLQNNFKVAICEQLEDPKFAKGLVKRGVKRVLTPGTILEDDFIESAENNFIMCIYSPKSIEEKFGLSVVDISTGEFFTSQISKLEDIKTLIRRYHPNEIILNENSYVRGLKEYIKNCGIYMNFLSDIRFNINYADQILKKQFENNSNGLGLSSKEFATISSGALLFYIYKLQKINLTHINKIKYINLNTNMFLDFVSLRNLEIVENLYSKDKNKTLFGILNNTKTNSGARLLKKNLTAPLISKKELEEIYDSITELNHLTLERDEIRDFLADFSDIERITSRIASHIATPKDLFALKISLQKLPQIKQILMNFQTKNLLEIKKIETLPQITELLEKSICDLAPTHQRDIGYIKPDFNEELKKLSNLAFNSKGFIKELEETERLKTKISTLRIRYNKIFGYFIEIPSSQSLKVPENYILRQTLANNHRYILDELKEKETLILGAEEKIKVLEKEIFNEVLEKLKTYVKKFQEISKKIAKVDVLTTSSYNSQIYNYSRPEFNKDQTKIIDGRNPLVERFTPNFIPNNTTFNEKQTLKIVTGPNMAGKSTYLRQNALIIIMAQSGSFIPVKSAKLKIYTRVFTRIGAHDELSEGQSTFMVEMSETANILNNANKNSLVLLDEIGRGTSTYDGLSIAWAVCEEIANLKCDTIFATHYHQLNSLEKVFENIQNYNVEVLEKGEKIEFIRKIIRGGTDKSYGIYVGKLANVPSKVLERAKEIQNNLENKEKITILINSKTKVKKESGRNLEVFF